MLRGIEVLSAIVDTGSFAAASEVLGMSPSGVSRAVSRFEARLGIRLFERTTRALKLTDEGHRFYSQVLPLMAELEECISDASQGAARVRGRLRVNVDLFFSKLMLGPRLGAFLESHPELQLELITRDDLGDLVGDGVDLALRFGHPQPSTLVARKMMEARIITVAAPAYIARRGAPAKPEDLAHHQCIHFRDPVTGRPFAWEFHRGRKRKVVDASGTLTVNDGDTLYSACLAGFGIAQVMDFTVESMLASGELVNLFPEWSDERFPLYCYYPSRRQLPAKSRAFIDYVAGFLQE
ncbi:LysR family transcriptional regulator [Pseudoduganella sp. UC29_106]|uniref:LysR family transcriptional regulator n=1 Tax=Pseudoduganella sp. UC29_106 TaxID=3374553 RepID=UPI0037569D0A